MANMDKSNLEIYAERCLGVIKDQKLAVKFLIKHPEKWHTYATDSQTVEVVCSLSNLGIAKINSTGQWKLKSAEHAERFLR
jgi:hypothetical protein